jgi:hypothetical protein
MTQEFNGGNITTVVGDDIIFDVNNIPTDLDYTLFVRVYDKENNTIIPDLPFPCNYNDTVTVIIPHIYTDLVSIPLGKKFVKHFYGMKVCNIENQVEHTQTIDGLPLDEETTITFMRKRAEGYSEYPIDTDTDTDDDPPITTTLYAWGDETIIYTLSDTPAVDDEIYDSSGNVTEQTIEGLILDEQENIIGITVDNVGYDRNSEADIILNANTNSDTDTETDTDTEVDNG